MVSRDPYFCECLSVINPILIFIIVEIRNVNYVMELLIKKILQVLGLCF